MVNIFKNYKNFYALKGVNFSVSNNEIVGLVGDNGAGKSTLMKILVGSIPRTQGEIYFKGREVYYRSPRDARKDGIEIVFQDAMLVDTMNIQRNFFLGREPVKRKFGISILDNKRIFDESDKSIRNLAINLRSLYDLVLNLSGGERQVISVGRALYFGAKLLILDEPTNNLSVKESQSLLSLVVKSSRRQAAVIFISHNVHHVFSVAHRIVVLGHGRIIENIKKSNPNCTEDYIIEKIKEN